MFANRVWKKMIVLKLCCSVVDIYIIGNALKKYMDRIFALFVSVRISLKA